MTTRKYTMILLELADQGAINWEYLARDALGWMSEDDVKRFAQQNCYLEGLMEYEDE